MSTRWNVCTLEDLTGYEQVSIAYEVRSELSIRASGLAGITLEEEPVVPWRKDYDALNGGPVEWARRFDTRALGVLAVFDGDARVGGAVVVANTPELQILRDEAGLAALWDLRVQPSHRALGVGRALFTAAEAWARAQGYTALQIETQTTNVSASQFYARQGCTLAAIDRFAYPLLPRETQLIWRKTLTSDEPARGPH